MPSTWPTPRVWTAGERVSASKMNELSTAFSVLYPHTAGGDIAYRDPAGDYLSKVAKPALDALLKNTNAGVPSYLPIVDLLALLMPVGYVLTLGVSTNPATLFGFGTWAAIEGRVIVGIDASQTEFDTLNETGGAKTHTLVSGEMPAHTHTVGIENVANAGGSVGSRAFYGGSTATSSAGGGAAHNNLQPYIVKYCWERTA